MDDYQVVEPQRSLLKTFPAPGSCHSRCWGKNKKTACREVPGWSWVPVRSKSSWISCDRIFLADHDQILIKKIYLPPTDICQLQLDFNNIPLELSMHDNCNQGSCHNAGTVADHRASGLGYTRYICHILSFEKKKTKKTKL